MHKKLFISFAILISLIFSFTICFANDGGNMVKDAADNVRNAVGGVENTVENAAKDVANTSKNVTGNMENGANNVGNNMENNNHNNQQNTSTNNLKSNDYNATRTSTGTTSNTFMGMNATAWTWLIIGIVAIAIVALVWYYAMQTRSSDYNDKD